ncbi:HemK methyltransferase member 1, partial [Perkinsus olseni]
ERRVSQMPRPSRWGARTQLWAFARGSRQRRIFPYCTGKSFLLAHRYTAVQRKETLDEETACLRWLKESIRESRRLREAVRSRALRWTPYQYLVGQVDFLHLKDFCVRPPTLIPRPETELMVERILESRPPTRRLVLDLCSGSGVIGIALATEWADSRVDLVDASERAMSLARENAGRYGVDGRLSFLVGAIGDQEFAENSYDMIVSNPPYIPTATVENLSRTVKNHEDILALDGGVRGMDIVRQVLDVASVALKPGGLLWMEVYAEAEQHRLVEEYIARYHATRLHPQEVVSDLRDMPRFVVVRKAVPDEAQRDR